MDWTELLRQSDSNTPAPYVLDVRRAAARLLLFVVVVMAWPVPWTDAPGMGWTTQAIGQQHTNTPAPYERRTTQTIGQLRGGGLLRQ